jgi:hypothetical protein
MSQASRDEQRRQLRECWKERIDNWRQSGLKQNEYCRRHDLNWHQFVYWKKRLIAKEPTTVSFVPVTLGALERREPPLNGALLKVQVGGRFKIEIEQGFDAHLLWQVIHALEMLA